MGRVGGGDADEHQDGPEWTSKMPAKSACAPHAKWRREADERAAGLANLWTAIGALEGQATRVAVTCEWRSAGRLWVWLAASGQRPERSGRPAAGRRECPLVGRLALALSPSVASPTGSPESAWAATADSGGPSAPAPAASASAFAASMGAGRAGATMSPWSARR